MAWERGAWEKATSNPYRYSSNSGYNTRPSPKSFLEKPRTLTIDKKKENLKNTLGKFLNKGWKIPKKKKTLYLNNNYFNSPYILSNEDLISEKVGSLISSKSNNNKFLIVCNDQLISDKILLELKIKDRNVFNSIRSLNYLKNLNEYVDEFKKINKSLFNKYSVCIFQDIKSTGQLSDLKILSQNLKYIDNSKAKVLNEFIKIYWQYYDLSSNSNIDLNLAEKDVVKEVSSLSNKFTIIKNYVKRLTKIFEIIDVNIEDLDDFNIEILKSNPTLINYNQSQDFLSCLADYHQINTTNETSNDFLDNFLTNSYLLGIIANYKRFINGKNDYNKINTDILDLKSQFESVGLNLNNLNDYLEIKDKLTNFNDVIYFENQYYYDFKNKIHEFLKFNLSFNEFLNRCKNNLIFNLDSNSVYLRTNECIEDILKICSEMGLKLNSLKEYDDHKDDLKILLDQHNVSKVNNESNNLPIEDYTKNLFEDLKSITRIVINKRGDILDSSDLDLIIHNINIVNNLIDEIGININTLKELSDSFPIIANIEKDYTNEIFTSNTSNFLSNDKSIIYNELTNLKNSLDYLINQIGDNSNLINLSLVDLKKTFKNYYKFDFIIDTLDSYLESTNNFEDIIQNYPTIIKLNINLIDDGNLEDFKLKLQQITHEFKLIEKTYNDGESNISIGNSSLSDNISSFKNSVNEKFNELRINNFFDADKIEKCDVENNLNNLNKNIESIQDFIRVNGFYNTNFNDILSKNNSIINKNDDIKLKIENSSIYNFNEICNELNLPNYDFDIINEILYLSSKVGIKDIDKFQDFDINNIKELDKFLEYSEEFSGYVNNNCLNKDFRFSSEKFNIIDSKIDSIKKDLSNLNLDDSFLQDFDQINIDNFEDIKIILDKIDQILKDEPFDVDVKLNNYKDFINLLLDLCNNHYIEFEIDNIKFNSSDFKENLEVIKNKLEYNIRLSKVETELLSFSDLIENNLQEIWKGPLTNFNSVKNKFDMDVEFTKLYKKGIFTSKSVENMNNLTESDVIFLDKLKTNKDEEFKQEYKLFYENKDYLIQNIDKLNEINQNDYELILDSLVNINKIFKSSEISDCINLLEYNIKHNNTINILHEYEDKLKDYSVLYYTFFNRRKFDMSMEEVEDILNQHFKYTELIENNIVNESYLPTIKSNFDDFSAKVRLLEDLKNKIIKDFKKYFGNQTISFDFIKKEYEKAGDAGIILMNLNSVKNTFDKNYVEYFDFVYHIEDQYVLDEDKLHLFLLSKNKLSILKLREGS